jgi:hypothetical protein
MVGVEIILNNNHKSRREDAKEGQLKHNKAHLFNNYLKLI